jgi:catalase
MEEKSRGGSYTAALVADRVGLPDMRAPAPSARPTRTDRKPSLAFVIQFYPPDSFEGRLMGVMLRDSFDGSLLAALEKSVAKEGGLIEIIASRIGGVLYSRDNLHVGQEKIGSAPSLLFDEVSILPGKDSLATASAVMALLTDAFQH